MERQENAPAWFNAAANQLREDIREDIRASEDNIRDEIQTLSLQLGRVSRVASIVCSATLIIYSLLTFEPRCTMSHEDSERVKGSKLCTFLTVLIQLVMTPGRLPSIPLIAMYRKTPMVIGNYMVEIEIWIVDSISNYMYLVANGHHSTPAHWSCQAVVQPSRLCSPSKWCILFGQLRRS